MLKLIGKKQYDIKEDNMVALPCAITFDIIPVQNENIAINNVYTHLINPTYSDYIITNTQNKESEMLSILNTLSYAFQNRVKYFIRNAVSEVVFDMSMTYRLDNENLYNTLFDKLITEFGNPMLYLEKYFNNEVTMDSTYHMIASMETGLYDTLLGFVQHKGCIVDYDELHEITGDFHQNLINFFKDYIFIEVETVYKPQILALADMDKGILENIQSLPEGNNDGVTVTHF